MYLSWLIGPINKTIPVDQTEIGSCRSATVQGTMCDSQMTIYTYLKKNKPQACWCGTPEAVVEKAKHP